MITQREKHEALKRVLESNTFKKSTTLNVLLKMLVEATFNEREISAVTIGMELFGKKYEPEKSDVNVRVNISHLRKRLNKYYLKEGAQNNIQISIEPGQYRATFTKKTRYSAHKVKRNRILIILFAFFTMSLGYFWISQNTEKVWAPIFNNKMETTLYLGDVFGYTGPSVFSEKGWHRDSKINSAKDFYELTKESSEKYNNLEPADYTYVVFENSYNIKPQNGISVKRNRMARVKTPV